MSGTLETAQPPIGGSKRKGCWEAAKRFSISGKGGELAIRVWEGQPVIRRRIVVKRFSSVQRLENSAICHAWSITRRNKVFSAFR